jgi:hypothetical protein
MPNEQTTVPLFVAAEVLTAADMNLSAGTGVPVFSNSTTRDAGFGGAGEKVLAEGQLCYLSDSNIVQYYSGSAWATVGPAAAATSGLTCVKAETAFSAVASVTADGILTSAYTNYLLLVNYTTSTTVFASLKLRASGTSASTNYNRQYINGNDTAVAAARATSASSYDFGFYTNGDYKSSARVELFAPQLAQATNFISLNAVSPAGYTPLNMFMSGNHSTATAYDGIEILVSSGTMTGTYAVYGYSKTV